MSNVIQLPIVAGVEITTDAEGRFNLNALHKASGGEKKKGPSYWLALEGTKELISKLEEQTTVISVVTIEGRNGGTFAHELLSISYAGWISPAFHLSVNQVFLDYRAGNLNMSPALPETYSEALRRLADESEQNETLRLENQQQAGKIDKLENFFQPGMTITAFGKMLNGVNCAKMSGFCCEELNWLYNESRSGNNKRWRAGSYARDRYLTETNRPIGVHGGDSFIKHEPKLLKQGAQKLYDLYLAGRLPMKKTWDGEFVHMKFEGEAA